MANDRVEADDLLARAALGDALALAEVFERHRPRLEQMVRVRLDRRLHGRLDPADVVQETYLVLVRRFSDFAAAPGGNFYLWLRQLATQALIDLHRRHLGAKMRDAGLEISLSCVEPPRASSLSVAELLLGRLTSASHAAMRAETQMRIEEALNRLDPIDREVLVLRHFELLTNAETASVLGIQESAASKRYLRALRRLKEHLGRVAGGLAGV